VPGEMGMAKPGDGIAYRAELRVAVGILAGLALMLSSCVVQAVASPPATRDIRVTISGLHFVPDHFDVHLGETIRFVVTNPTDLPHELFIGTMAEQLAHHREVMNQPPLQQRQLMQHTGYGIYLEPYDSGQFIYRFSQAGQVMIGCHVPGHWEAGMLATITVRS
jgi:uncharacterized cupredoxin-like copper-binding protein